MKSNITHDINESLFYTDIQGETAYLKYRMSGNDVMDFSATYVPPSLRGKGVAADLVEAGLQYARQNNFKIIPSCWYVEVYLERNKKYDDLVIK